MPRVSLHDTLVTNGFRFVEASGCSCNDYYILNIGDFGGIVIIRQTCKKNGRSRQGCPFYVKHVKAGKLIDEVPYTGDIFHVTEFIDKVVEVSGQAKDLEFIIKSRGYRLLGVQSLPEEI